MPRQSCTTKTKTSMKKLILLILVAIGAFVPTLSSAQLYAMRDSVQNGYNFWLYLPDGYEDRRAERIADPNNKDAKEPLPIVVFLHGRSLSGTNLNTVRKYGTIDAIKRGRKINAVVIAPQVNHGDWWRPERVMNVVEWVSKRYDVDTTRLYVLGMSLGGYGTLDFAAAYPDRTAAAIALCGGSTKKNAQLGQLNEVPLWIMHGTADASVAVSESRRVKKAMEEANAKTPRLRYDEWAGANHGIYARVFYMSQAYEWMFKHRTTDINRPVDRSVDIPTSLFSTVYHGLPRGGIALQVYDPPTKSNTKGRYMAEGAPLPENKNANKEQKSDSDDDNTKADGGAKEQKEQKKSSSTTTQNTTSSSSETQYHTIVEGDTLGHIAAKYDTTVKALCELNGIDKSDILSIGKKLKVKEVATEVEVVYHTVAADDTSYYAIAKKYNTTVEKIMELNGLSEPKFYRVGEQIIVAKREVTKTSTKQTSTTKSSNKSAEPQYHTIAEGDTLGHIAIKYDTSVKKLCELNNIEKDAILSIGKKLRVK